MSRSNDSFLAARYQRVKRRRGANRAAVAVAHSTLTILWHLMADPDARYQDLGADFYQNRQDPQRQATRLVKQLAELGYTATLTPAA